MGKAVIMEFGIQQYTIEREFLQAPERTAERLAEAGFIGMELYGRQDPISVRRALEQAGLRVLSRHTEWAELQEGRLSATLDMLAEAHCPVCVVPALGGPWCIGHSPAEECAAVWEGYILWMNRLLEQLEARGMVLGYHNHRHELQLVYGGQRVFDRLFRGFDRRILLELDTGSCLEEGVSPADLLHAHTGRRVLLHLKPFGRRQGLEACNADGDDMNDYKALFAACEGRLTAAVIEQEGSNRSLETALRCLENLRRV